jgi:hypothetical protein
MEVCLGQNYNDLHLGTEGVLNLMLYEFLVLISTTHIVLLRSSNQIRIMIIYD